MQNEMIGKVELLLRDAGFKVSHVLSTHSCTISAEHEKESMKAVFYLTDQEEISSRNSRAVGSSLGKLNIRLKAGLPGVLGGVTNFKRAGQAGLTRSGSDDQPGSDRVG